MEKKNSFRKVWLKLRRNSDWGIQLTKSQLRKEPERVKVKSCFIQHERQCWRFSIDKETFFEPSESCSVVSDSLWSHGLYSPWNAPGQNTGVVSLSLLQGIFPTQGLNPGLLHCRWILYQLSHKWSQRILEWVAYPFSRGSSWPRDQTQVSRTAARFFTSWAVREAKDQCNIKVRVSWTPSLPGGYPDGNVVMEVGSKGEGLYSQLVYSAGTNTQLRKRDRQRPRRRKGDRDRQTGRWRLLREGSGSSFALVAPDRAQSEPQGTPSSVTNADFPKNHMELLFPRVY